MQFSRLHFVVLLTLLVITRAAALELEYLTATAVISDDNGDAKIQCWQFTKELTIYPTIGKVLPFGEVSNLSYVVLPPGSAEGIHKPPHPMLFVLLAGLAHVTLPSGPEEAWIMEGVNGFLVATDTNGIGHYTTYPSNKNTIALQIPFKDGIVPEHVVLKKSGACNTPEQVIKANNIEEWYIRTDL